MTSEGDTMAGDRKRSRELKAFAEARENVRSKAKEFMEEADGQLSELKKRTVEGFKEL